MPAGDRPHGANKGYAVSLLWWAFASISHAFVRTVTVSDCPFCAWTGIGGQFPARSNHCRLFPVEERALPRDIFLWIQYALVIAPCSFLGSLSDLAGRLSPCHCGLSLIWLAAWLLFPYRRMPRAAPHCGKSAIYVGKTPRARSSPCYATGEHWNSPSPSHTDPVWWIYLLVPKYFNENFQMTGRR